MSNTKIISKSPVTHDVEYYENDPIQQMIEAESQKQMKNKESDKVLSNNIT